MEKTPRSAGSPRNRASGRSLQASPSGQARFRGVRAGSHEIDESPPQCTFVSLPLSLPLACPIASATKSSVFFFDACADLEALERHHLGPGALQQLLDGDV